jgi:hypothetical protein
MLKSVLSQVYISFNHREQSRPYLGSCEVLIYGVLKVVRFFIGPRVESGVLVNYPDRGIVVHAPRSLQSRSLTGSRSWGHGTYFMIIAELVFKRL